MLALLSESPDCIIRCATSNILILISADVFFLFYSVPPLENCWRHRFIMWKRVERKVQTIMPNPILGRCNLIYLRIELCVYAYHPCTVQYSTVQYSTVQYSTVQYSTVQYSTVQYSTVQYSTVQYSTTQIEALYKLSILCDIYGSN
jgi:hypothetical protein